MTAGAAPQPRLAMVAGEASGDLLGGLLLGGLRQRWPDLLAQGIGGPQMLARGFESWWPQERLAVSGYVEALRHYRALSAIRSQLAQRLIGAPPQAFIGIDAPDFNLGLEARLKAAGIKTIHFVSPSIWAWRGRRIEQIGRATDLVLCIFPFEPALYARHGIAAAYVGHPLADVIPLDVPRAQARAQLGLGDADTVVALLPGSRAAEVRYIAPRLLQAAALMHERRPGLRFVLPTAPGMRAPLQAMLDDRPGAPSIELLDGQSHAALAACDVALLASGTATLEAALFKCPMVIAYVMHPVNWQLMKRMRYQPWVGLPNILLEEFVVPEFLQSEASGANLAQAGLAWLDDPARAQALRDRFRGLHERLRCNTAQAATEAIGRVLAR